MLKRKIFSAGLIALLPVNLMLTSSCTQRTAEATEYTNESTAAEGSQATDPAPSSRWLGRVFSRREVVSLPAGTMMSIELLETVGSAINGPGDTIKARVAKDVMRNGEIVIPAGSLVIGSVTEAVPTKKIGGQAKLGMEFTSVEPRSGYESPIRATYYAEGKSQVKKDAATIGGAAAGGAILGRIIGHKQGDEGKGTAIGAIVGGAAGTAVAAKNKRDELVVPAGMIIRVRFASPAQITV